MIEISKNVVYVKGAKNGAIYNFNEGEVFSVNDIACSIIEKIIKSEDLNFEEIKYKNLLIDAMLIDEFFDKQEYIPQNSIDEVKLVWLEITQACNMKCIHCYEGNEHKVNKNSLSLDEWKNVIDQINQLNVNRVVIIGGEPSIHKDIAKIAEYTATKGINTTIFTNGSEITEDLKAIIMRNHIEVKLSLYGHNSNIHDSITQVPGSFDVLVNTIRFFVEHGVKVSIAIVLMQENEEYYNDITDFVKSLNVNRYKFDVIREVFFGNQNLHVPRKKEIVNFAKRSSPKFNISKTKFDKANFKNTCWAGKLVISEDGNVLPCVFERNISCGNIRKKTIKEILKSSELSRCWNMTFEKINQCNECEFRFACNDCRPLAMSINGCIEDKNPRCTYDVYNGEWK